MQDAPDWLKRFSASAVASSLAEAVTLPFDTCKVRLQLQKVLPPGVAPADPARYYNGMTDAMRKIYGTEGMGGLCKGMIPAQARQISNTSLTLVAYTPIREAFTNLSGHGGAGTSEVPFWVRLMAGGTAGGVVISMLNPIEVIKTKMQGHVGAEAGPGMATIARDVYARGGLAAFWAGVRPNVARCFLVNAAELGTYDEAKTALLHKYGFPDGMPAHVTASAVAGFTSAAVSTPVDVVKTRLMNTAGGAQEYAGMFEALFHPSKSVAAREGPLALYKGFNAIFARKVVWCTVFFVGYEQLLAAQGYGKDKEAREQ